MPSLNPYESPGTESGPAALARPRFDAGKITGQYLRTLGVLSILNMIVSLVFFDRLDIDITFVFLFWAARHLTQHSQTARKWTIGICVFNLIGILFFLIYTLVFGTSGMTLKLGNSTQIPQIQYVILFLLVIAIFVAIPIWLLLTPEARSEFSKKQAA